MRTQIVGGHVREHGKFMSLTPAEGGWRVAIVDGAEEMNRTSANALLKILEEPPSRAILLLVCAAPGRLLATIRSRCRRLRLDPWPPEHGHPAGHLPARTSPRTTEAAWSPWRKARPAAR